MTINILNSPESLHTLVAVIAVAFFAAAGAFINLLLRGGGSFAKKAWRFEIKSLTLPRK